jgi:hypothetical protein
MQYRGLNALVPELYGVGTMGVVDGVEQVIILQDHGAYNNYSSALKLVDRLNVEYSQEYWRRRIGDNGNWKEVARKEPKRKFAVRIIKVFK